MQAEAHINAATRYNWSDAYAALNADVKHLLSEAESNFVAIYIINYNMAVYTSRYEAEVMINLLRFNLQECIRLLNEIKHQDFITGA